MIQPKNKSSKKTMDMPQGRDAIIHDPIFTETLLERLNKSGIIVVDSKGNCRYVSKKALDILRINKRYIIGKNFSDAIPLNTIEDQPINDRKHPVRLALDIKPYTQITPFFCKPGYGDAPGTLAMNVLQIKKKNKVHSVVIQLRKAERELNIGEMKSLFVSFAAHQLKTPSSIVKGFLELLMREGQKSYSTDQWNFLISAFESNEHLIHVSKTLLSLARLEGGLIAPQISQFDPRMLLQGKIKSLDALLKIKQISVSLNPERKGFINSDQSFFLEIFEILFANAIKHSHNNTAMEVTCKTSQYGVEVHVIDNGPGVSDSMKEKLFVSAQGTDTDKNTHGLGLYMAKKYVALLGGSIGVQDGLEGRGSDFFFTIPNS